MGRCVAVSALVVVVERMCVVLDNGNYSGSLGTFPSLHTYAPFKFTGVIVKIKKRITQLRLVH